MAVRLGVCLMALATMAGAACSGSASQSRVGPGFSTLYTVTSIVMQKPGEPPRACAFMQLPDPPIGCGGPDLHTLDLTTMHGVTRYRNGVLATSMLHLVGTWDGRALTLTRPPDTAPIADATSMPQGQCPSQPAQVASPPLMQRVISDEALLKAQGIQLLEFGPCGDSLFIVVTVADRDSVRFLTNRYGAVQVAGWLKPVSSPSLAKSAA